MYRTIRKIRIATGTTALAVGAAYVAAGVMASTNDVTLSPRMSNIALHLITGFAVLSGVAWVVDLAHKEAVARDLPPALTAAVEAAVTVAADRNYARTVAAMREVVHSDLVAEELDEAVRRAHRWGMIAEAGGRSNVASIRRN